MFANKVVLITGSSSGIGAATAQCFAKEGASLAIVARNETKLKTVAENCERLGSKYVLIIKADVTKEDEAKTIIKQTIDKFGKLDVLINNAGILRFAKIEDSHVLEIYDEVLNTNLRSVVHLTHLAARYLIATQGNIVNVSSVASKKTSLPGMSAYNLSKAALDHFTRSAAVEFAPSRVRVNSINPGPCFTNITESANFPKEAYVGLGNIENITALGRISQPEEIGNMILYITSDKAESVTGSCFVIDNGSLLK